MSSWTGSAAGSTSSTSRPAWRGGFTLLEVLIAFTILAVALVALLQAFSSGFRGLGAAEANAIAVIHARSKIAEIGPLIPLEAGTHDGLFDDGFRWFAEIRPYGPDAEAESEALPVIAYEIEMTVSWEGGQGVTLTTLRLAPRR
ncbi:MAG: prepilin-type N-terminal cleavage/methylation domain-containing protein [Kiloniellaceae bacterium]